MQRLGQENKHSEGASANDPNTISLHRLFGPSFQTHQHATQPDVAIPKADQGLTIQGFSYHLNDLAIPTGEAVDPYEMPAQEHAQTLFVTYMHRVHPSFPVVGRINLQNQFVKFLSRPGSKAPPKWLAIINLIFAIASQYSHRIQVEWRADERDHLIYCIRARMLIMRGETLFDHPDLQLIQVLGLMSYYFLAVDQVNRA